MMYFGGEIPPKMGQRGGLGGSAKVDPPKRAIMLLKHSRRGIPQAGSMAAELNATENSAGVDAAPASCRFVVRD